MHTFAKYVLQKCVLKYHSMFHGVFLLKYDAWNVFLNTYKDDLKKKFANSINDLKKFNILEGV